MPHWSSYFHAHPYQFNGHGDLIRLTSPDTGITQYTPDAAGNADVIVDARNESGDYIYDAISRVSAITYSDQTIGFEYDQGINAIGRMTRMTDGSGNTQWSYDTEGRVETKQQTVGAVVRSVQYDYNTSGQLSEITTPSGQAIGYTHANGRIAAITVNGATLLNQVLYEPFGPVRGWSWANGTLTVREYDTDWQLGAIDSVGLSTYGYLANGQIQSQTDDMPVSFTLPAGITSYTPGSSSNRIAASAGVQARTYIHDAAGHSTSDGSRSFNYDDSGRLVSATSAGVTTMYQVNALGQRVRKSNASLTRIFVYDEPGRLIGEYDASGNLVQETVWFDEMPVATLRPKAGGGIDVFYIHTDHLNTPRKISRPTDNVVLWRWASDPFGQAAAAEDVDGDTQIFKFNLRFPGQYFDAETGLHYNYFRDYSPEIGRYLQSDPIGLDGGINTYAYVDGNPLNFWDRLGLAKCRYSISKHTMICQSDDGSRAGMVGPEGVFSGFRECQNNPECADDKNRGPVPPGDYEMVPSDKYGGSWWLKEGFFTRQLCKMGTGRCEFFFHRGTISAGCITADKYNSRTSGQFERIRRILRGDSRNTLTVEP